jgi:hypothetical protein
VSAASISVILLCRFIAITVWIYYYYGKNDGTFPTQATLQATLQTLVLRAPVPGRDVGGRRHQRHHLHLEQHLGLLARP